MRLAVNRDRSRTWARAAIAASALTAATAVVGLAARAPLSRSTPVDAASARAPVTALALLLFGLGAVMIGALIAFVWSQRRRKDEAPEPVPEPTEVPWFWKLWRSRCRWPSARRSSQRRNRRANPQGAKGLSSAFGASGPNLTQRTPKPAGSGFVVPEWLPWTLLVMVAVTIVAAVWFLVFRQPRMDEPDDRAAAEAAMQAAIAALDTDRDARAAVIAAYAAMERTLADMARLARRPKPRVSSWDAFCSRAAPPRGTRKRYRPVRGGSLQRASDTRSHARACSLGARVNPSPLHVPEPR